MTGSRPPAELNGFDAFMARAVHRWDAWTARRRERRAPPLQARPTYRFLHHGHVIGYAYGDVAAAASQGLECARTRHDPVYIDRAVVDAWDHVTWEKSGAAYLSPRLHRLVVDIDEHRDYLGAAAADDD